MIDKIRNIVVVCLTAAVIFGLAAAGLMRESDMFSESERRTLAQMPELSSDTLLSGKFMDNFEVYTQDQFPMRETFRSVKAIAVKNLLMQSDNNDIYVADGYVSKLEYPLNTSMLEYAAGRFQFIYDNFLEESGANVYLSIIPDKNYFLAEKNGYLALDYDELFKHMQQKTAFAEYIDITDTLAIDKYYRTDTHWKQEEILAVADRIVQTMGAKPIGEYTVNTLEVPFYGVYKGQSALPLEADTIKYITTPTLDGCTVTSYDTGKPRPAYVYDMDAANGADPYEMFMSGSDALLVLENPEAETERELVIFRDSFGSSLAPLLAEGYSKVTLADIRYMQSGLIGNFIEFDENCDVLFIYSTTLLNNSGALK